MKGNREHQFRFFYDLASKLAKKSSFLERDNSCEYIRRLSPAAPYKAMNIDITTERRKEERNKGKILRIN